MIPGLSGATRLAGVVGRPVAQSLSPVLHNAWIAATGLDAVYVAFAPPADGFAALAAGLKGSVLGLNVTAPFKRDALSLADRLSERARRAGAVNLLVYEAGGVLAGDNTDGEGLLAAFAEQAPGFDPAAGPVVLLGAGGAARGAAAAFLDAGAPRVDVVNRSAAAAETLRAALGGRVQLLAPDALDDALASANAVVNARPNAEPIDLCGAGPATVVMDMIYTPLETPLLTAARRRGLRVVDGLAMLIGQARPSFEAIFGQSPPPLDVRSLALSVLEARS